MDYHNLGRSVSYDWSSELQNRGASVPSQSRPAHETCCANLFSNSNEAFSCEHNTVRRCNVFDLRQAQWFVANRSMMPQFVVLNRLLGRNAPALIRFKACYIVHNDARSLVARCQWPLFVCLRCASACGTRVAMSMRVPCKQREVDLDCGRRSAALSCSDNTAQPYIAWPAIDQDELGEHERPLLPYNLDVLQPQVSEKTLQYHYLADVVFL
jgi:hypothetical protein